VVKRLSYYAIQANELLFNEFAGRYAEHVLVIVPAEDDTSSDPSFDPMLSTEFDHETPLARPRISDAYRVTPLRKKAGLRTFGMPLTVGRASNNDVVLQDIQVSKVHALLGEDDQGVWWIRDSNSTNGTFVSEQRIPSDGKTLIRSADSVKFGPGLSAVFFSPADFYQFLRSNEVVEALL